MPQEENSIERKTTRAQSSGAFFFKQLEHCLRSLIPSRLTWNIHHFKRDSKTERVVWANLLLQNTLTWFVLKHITALYLQLSFVFILSSERFSLSVPEKLQASFRSSQLFIRRLALYGEQLTSLDVRDFVKNLFNFILVRLLPSNQLWLTCL